MIQKSWEGEVHLTHCYFFLRGRSEPGAWGCETREILERMDYVSHKPDP